MPPGRESGALFRYIKTSIGVTTTDIFHVVKTPSGEKLIANSSKPSTPGITPGTFTLRRLDLTISGTGKHPYITAPATCTGHWSFALTIRNWFGQPSVTARDRAACTP